ncbi:hypothetical protein [Marinomonas algarum]|uniref:Uncharacterized protein n=1 Tax=Marinomonas algarum TaxID=2883105 RepID=A0A9X1LD00_9GAMM|nr:hypothetical protein [Marinomonas algarum]MCB5161967.1 hypothetical protein [Marinomonas algarum]
MTTPHSPFGAPRKELINSLQKGVVALLLLLVLAFAGAYVYMSSSLEKQNAQQDKLTALLGLVYSAEEHWSEWLLLQDASLLSESDNPPFAQASHLHQMLTSEYQLMDEYLQSYEWRDEVSIKSSLSLLARLSKRSLDRQPLTAPERQEVYASFLNLKVINNRLIQLGVDYDYQRQTFLSELIWIPVGIFLFIATIVIVLSVRFERQLRSGFALLHYVLDHRRHGHAGLLPERALVDAFTDISHIIDNELASKNFDLSQQSDRLELMESALTKVSDAFIITDQEGCIVWLSSSAEQLWRHNIAVFESLFDIDSGLDVPTGERVVDTVLLSNEPIKLALDQGVYWLSVEPFIEEDNGDQMAEESATVSHSCFITLRTKADQAELEVLHHSLMLLSKDIWNVPIRVLREDSPYFSFARSLERVRLNVVALFDALDFVSDALDPAKKITKLQQIPTVLEMKTEVNETIVENDSDEMSVSTSAVQAELEAMAELSQQVRDSLLLGYELVLQRLALVEKDLSSDVFLLSEVDRCLNEVRSGVLTSLSSAQGESEVVRHRFAVDVEHDISLVQTQIDEMKSVATSTLLLLESDRSVGMARLDRARVSISDMSERIHGLISTTLGKRLPPPFD